MTKVIFSHPKLPKVTIVIYSILQGDEDDVVVVPIGVVVDVHHRGNK